MDIKLNINQRKKTRSYLILPFIYVTNIPYTVRKTHRFMLTYISTFNIFHIPRKYILSVNSLKNQKKAGGGDSVCS